MNRVVLGVLVFVLVFGLTVADLGEGDAMEEEEFYFCFRNIHCFNGEEAFENFLGCYDKFGTEMYAEMFYLMLNASKEAGKSFKATKPDPRAIQVEFCNEMKEDERKSMFDQFILLIVDKFTEICSDENTKDKCKFVEKGLDCCFTQLERAAEAKQCELPEGVQ